MKNSWPERHYIDLFAGAGHARIDDTDEIVQTSAILAATVRDPFTKLHLCERDPTNAAALKIRLGRLDPSPTSLVTMADANEAIHKVLENVPAGALSVAFADPFGLHLDFETVRAIAHRRCDLIILLADNMDALRNWAAYYDKNPNSNLDRFMGEGGWRDTLANSPTNQRAERLRARYFERLKSLRYSHIDSVSIQNDHGNDIYSLVYASRSSVGLKFWREARAVSEDGQRFLF